MPAPAARIVLAGLLLAPAGARADPAKPPAPQAQPAPPRVQPAPRPPVQRDAAPARPSPAAPPRRPAPAAKPPAKPVPKPAAPVPAAVPEAVPEKPAEPQKGTNSGLPLPRFAALRSDEVNLRTGPGTRYPIEWVYKRRDLPVQIEREFEVWRLVRDQEGIKGWVHQATLAPRRTAIVIGAKPAAAAAEHVLRRDARDDASPVARLKPGVIVRLRSCEAAFPWCQAQVGDYRGWIKRAELWGVSPDEAIQ